MVTMPDAVQQLLREGTPEALAVAYDWFEENQLRRPTKAERETLFGVRERGGTWTRAAHPFDPIIYARFTIPEVRTGEVIVAHITGIRVPNPRCEWSLEELATPMGSVMWIEATSIASRWPLLNRIWFLPREIRTPTIIGGAVTLEIRGEVVERYEPW